DGCNRAGLAVVAAQQGAGGSDGVRGLPADRRSRGLDALRLLVPGGEPDLAGDEPDVGIEPLFQRHGPGVPRMPGGGPGPRRAPARWLPGPSPRLGMALLEAAEPHGPPDDPRA